MKIEIKNLRQDTFYIDIDMNLTVYDLKVKIKNVMGDEYNVDKQYLIYSGLIMSDGDQLIKYKISEGKFIVVMLKNKKQININENLNVNVHESNGDTKSNTEKNNSEVQQDIIKTELKQDDKKVTENCLQSAVGEMPDIVVTDTVNTFEESLNKIIEMGYSRESAENAIRASSNNIELAIEYLISDMQNKNIIINNNININNNSNGNNDILQLPPNEEFYNFLNEQPQFLHIRQLTQENPSLLHGILEQIGLNIPSLFEYISNNRETFIEFLNERPNDTTAIDHNDTNLNSIAHNPNQFNDSIVLTQQEQDAIERLKLLGFPEDLVIQVYFACNKNELQTANFLLSENDNDPNH